MFTTRMFIVSVGQEMEQVLGCESNMQACLDEAIAYESLDDSCAFDEETGELVGVSEVPSRDWEVEHVVQRAGMVQDAYGFPTWQKAIVDDPSDLSCPCWTMSGNNPVIYSEAEQADQKRSAGGWSDIEPEYVSDFYSAAKTDGKKQERNFHLVAGFIYRNQNNPALLRKAWKRFWVRVYEEKGAFLFSKQVSCLKRLFEKHGICASSKKVA